MSSDSDSEYTDAVLSDNEDVHSPELERCVGCDFKMFPRDLDKDSGLCYDCERKSSTKPMGSMQRKEVPAQVPESAVTVPGPGPAEDRAAEPGPVENGAQEPRPAEGRVPAPGPVEDGAPALITAEGVTPAPRPAETLFEAMADDDNELEMLRIDKVHRELELQRISEAPNQTDGPLNASDLAKKVRVLQLFSDLMLSYYFNVERI